MRTWLLCLVSLWASTWAHRRLPISRQTAAISSMSGRLRPSHNVLAASALQQLRVAREVRACVGRTQHPANGGGRRARHTKCPGSRGGQQHAAAAACSSSSSGSSGSSGSSMQALRLADGAAVQVNRLSTKYGQRNVLQIGLWHPSTTRVSQAVHGGACVERGWQPLLEDGRRTQGDQAGSTHFF
jgi:hypothetical protein